MEFPNINYGSRIMKYETFPLELTSRKFQQKVNLSGSSLVKILKNLEDGDFIGKNPDNTYFILDPLLKFSLQLYYKEMLVIED